LRTRRVPDSVAPLSATHEEIAMKKLALAAVLFSAALASAACGSVCSDYETEAKKCCDKITDSAAKDLCNKNVETVVAAANSDACQAGLDAAKATCN
jgi:hypothetical protein